MHSFLYYYETEKGWENLMKKIYKRIMKDVLPHLSLTTDEVVRLDNLKKVNCLHPSLRRMGDVDTLPYYEYTLVIKNQKTGEVFSQKGSTKDKMYQW